MRVTKATAMFWLGCRCRHHIGGEEVTRDEEIRRYIDLAVKRTVNEYKKQGLIKCGEDAAYSEAAEVLRSYYKAKKPDASITYAIQGQRFDPYYLIIPMYFQEQATLEKIAEHFGVDVSTVVRNKKRLCLAIYNEIV